MAVIKYSGLVDQLRGKLNGTVFSRFNAGFNSYKKGQPSRWGSQSQQQKRQLLQKIAQSWKALPQADRDTYLEVAANTPVINRLGDEVTIPGFQYYVKYGLLFAQTDRSPRPNVITDLQKPSTGYLDLTALEISQQGDRYLIDSLSGQITITTTAGTTSYYLVSISSPFANEDLSYQSTYWYVGYLTVSADIPQDGTLAFNLTNILMPEGWRPLPDHYYRVRIHPVGYARAQERPPFYKKIEGTLSPEPTYLPYVISLSPYTYGRYWSYTQASYPVPVWTNIPAIGILNQELDGPGSDYEFITDVALTGQTSEAPDPAIWDLGYKTIVTTPLKDQYPNPLYLQIWPNAEALPQLNTAPLVTLSAEPTYLTVRYRLKRLSDGLETEPVFNTVNPNY